MSPRMRSGSTMDWLSSGRVARGLIRSPSRWSASEIRALTSAAAGFAHGRANTSSGGRPGRASASTRQTAPSSGFRLASSLGVQVLNTLGDPGGRGRTAEVMVEPLEDPAVVVDLVGLLGQAVV